VENFGGGLMSLLINLTPTEEKLFSDAAIQSGLAPQAFAEKFVREHLFHDNYSEDDVFAKIHQLQFNDKTKLSPPTSTKELFAQWTVEDADMTDEERVAEEQQWEEFQNGINPNRAELGTRLL
jgi:hypothetical protein